MSRTQRHIKKQSNTTNEESYAILQEPTNATFISKETMETNAKKRIYDKRVKLYMLNQDWLKVRKQKDRRRRRVLLKLWKAKQLAYLRRRYANVI